MEYFGNPQKNLADYDSMREILLKKKETIQISGCMDSGMVHLIYALGDGLKYKIIATYSAQKAREIYEDYKNFDSNVVLYPARDFIFFNADVHGNLLTSQRLSVIRAIFNEPQLTIVTTIDGLMEKMIPPSVWKENIMHFQAGERVDLDDVRKNLVAMGYERVAQVEEGGQFAVRGSILDIFPLTEEVPVRIDLWDDEIDMIKRFDAMSQRATANLEEVYIYPAMEMVLDEARVEKGIQAISAEAKKCEAKFRKQMMNEEAHRIRTTAKEITDQLQVGVTGLSLDSYIQYFYDDTVSLLDYLPGDDVVCFLDEPSRIAEHAEAVLEEFKQSMTRRLEKGYMLPTQADVIWDYKNAAARIETGKTVLLTLLDQKSKEYHPVQNYHVGMRNVNPSNSSYEMLIKDLKQYRKNQYAILLLAASRTRGQRMAKDLQDYEIPAFYTEDHTKELQPGEVAVTYGNVHRGYEYPLLKFVVITESDIFGSEKKKKKRKKQYSGEKIGSFSDLSIGDYVVHENHGLGIYRGIEKIDVEGVTKDYLKIEYSDGGNLYVPATGFDMVQKYAGADARKPKLNKLGTQEWNKTKTKVRSAVADIARDLVELYAKRQNKKGFVYSEDTVWQKEFEEMFPYQETDDQLNAIDAIKKDMESPKIMDRLVCGDVGYGKTEVAIRAAFKAVQDGKQVAILAPTTILAQQHYNTMKQRFKDFPLKVDLMCRFRTPAQQKQTLTDVQKGFVDILIGTHRILSKDVKYKDLGLLIVDEEQRFGVRHKEQIKQMKENIDVITLTATPIPRTLHMSLIGIRDMSVLEEPPVDRMPIQTYVMEYNDEMVREAINRELARNGQVYYVYNRVNNIEEIANNVQKLVPDAVVAYAHGQMSERRLEQIMYDFINGEIDVLVSTTIIETGMDIPNANTMIIHDADKLGLSQMYQLRGRVGRSNRTSYAFMMYKRDKMLKEVAEKRLSAIKEFTELGAGFKIAMRDLEIRGAGNLLGTAQHGHMQAVGYDLYCKMLNEAVLRLKGEPVQADFETTIDLAIDAFIPGTYIANEAQKLDVYKRIAAIASDEERMDMEDELMDRFGEMPKALVNLLHVAVIKEKAHQAYISDIIGNRTQVKLVLSPLGNIDADKIADLVALHRPALRFSPGKNPFFMYTLPGKVKTVDDVLKKLQEVVESFLMLQKVEDEHAGK